MNTKERGRREGSVKDEKSNFGLSIWMCGDINQDRTSGRGQV